MIEIAECERKRKRDLVVDEIIAEIEAEKPHPSLEEVATQSRETKRLAKKIGSNRRAPIHAALKMSKRKTPKTQRDKLFKLVRH